MFDVTTSRGPLSPIISDTQHLRWTSGPFRRVRSELRRELLYARYTREWLDHSAGAPFRVPWRRCRSHQSPPTEPAQPVKSWADLPLCPVRDQCCMLYSAFTS
jgi:hypothetical protein